MEREVGVSQSGQWRQATINGIDGPTLRSIRLSRKVPLRQIARSSHMSHGHLSKVERGEVGRPVTPAVLAAYAKATGVDLDVIEPGKRIDGWQVGQLSHRQRAYFNQLVGGLSIGGPLEDEMGLILDARGRLPLLTVVDDRCVQQLLMVAELLERLEGAVPGLVARTVLRWLVDVLDLHDKHREDERDQPITMGEHARAGLFAVVSRLARRAGRAAVEIGSHEAARTNLTVSLYAAVIADGADLRALALTEIGRQYQGFGQHDDCLAIARLALTDERVSEPVRCRLDELKARSTEARQQVLSAIQQVIDTSDNESDPTRSREETK
jgi:transcriptional regulator with XRE-family HTH domain